MQIKRSYQRQVREDFLADFVRRLRTQPLLAGAVVVLAVERNTGLEAGTLYDGVSTARGVGEIHYYRGADGDLGLWTDEARRIQYLYAARTLLDMGMLFLAPDYCAREPPAARSELCAQMRRARPLLVGGSGAGRAARWTWSAKVDADGHASAGMRDDVLMALFMCLYLLQGIRTHQSTVPARITGVAA